MCRDRSKGRIFREREISSLINDHIKFITLIIINNSKKLSHALIFSLLCLIEQQIRLINKICRGKK